jgi:hypothetical protein
LRTGYTDNDGEGEKDTKEVVVGEAASIKVPESDVAVKAGFESDSDDYAKAAADDLCSNKLDTPPLMLIPKPELNLDI